MYGCKSWTIKKPECWKIDAFQLCCWRRLLRVPWTARKSKPVNPEENQPWIFIGRRKNRSWSCSTTWCEELTHLKRPWCWERLRAGGEGDNRGWDGWMASLTRWTWVWASSQSWRWTGKPGVLQSIGSQRVGHDWVIELNWKGNSIPQHPAPGHHQCLSESTRSCSRYFLSVESYNMWSLTSFL